MADLSRTASVDSDATALLRLYRDGFRQFVEAQGAQGADILDRQAELLEQALARPIEVRIGFVGESQVGKSTLINAVLERRALPHGGIGPLTARATSVFHANEDFVKVTYHKKVNLNRLAFALQRYLALRGDLEASKVALAEGDVPPADDQMVGLLAEIEAAEDG